MATSSLPLDIKIFLTEYFESVTQLETLFRFYNNKTKIWTPQSLSNELRSHPVATSNYLHRLSSQGFIKQTENDKFIYHPHDGLDEMVKNSYALYLEKPVAVIACIYEKPNDKLKSFADAFKLKKD